MIEASDLTRSPGVLFGAVGVDVAGTTERVREVPRPITASDVVIGTRRRLPRNQVLISYGYTRHAAEGEMVPGPSGVTLGD